MKSQEQGLTMHPKFPVRCSVVAVLLAVGSLSVASAAEGDFLTLTATANYQYDSNVFRVTNGAEPTGFSHRGDSIWTESAAADLNKVIGRQRLYGNLAVTNYNYQDFSVLDNTAYLGTLGYRLGFGSDSEVGVFYTGTNKLSDYADRTGLYQRNMVNQARYGGDLLLRVAGSWLGVGSVTQGRDANSLYSQSAGNANVSSYDAGVRFSPRGSANYIEARYSESAVHYDPYNSGAGSVNSLYSYEQHEERIAGLWSPNQVSSIEAGAGLVHSDHERSSTLDFTGWSGHLGYIWRPTSASTTNVRASRSIGAAGDAWGSYARTNGLSLKQSWQATSKISLEGNAQYQERNYLGFITANTNSAGEDARHDKIYTLGASSAYAFSQKFTTRLSLNRERRASNVDGYSYRDLSATLSAEYKF
jgi:hypothetical protein